MTTTVAPEEATSFSEDREDVLDEMAEVIPDMDEQFTSADTEEVLFGDMVTKALCSAGLEQKRHRQDLFSLLPFLGNHDSKLSHVMALVQEVGSQEAMIAGIDLMAGFGDTVVDKAFEAALNSEYIGANAAFALTAAASRAQPKIVHWIAATAEHPAMIEAALEFLADQPPEEAVPVTRRILARERLPESIKKLAGITLADLEDVRASR
jgi:hypothetical protein